MAAFRVLLVVFALLVTYFAIRFIRTGRRLYLERALRLIAAALLSGVVFFTVLLLVRLVRLANPREPACQAGGQPLRRFAQG